MKKITFLATAVAVVCLMAGCQKDGKYTPKEKISKIYNESSYTNSYFDGEEWQTESDGSGKQLSEVWTWDGKMVSQIAYMDEGEAYNTIKFTYDGKQLAEASDGEKRMVFTYDGKKLEKIEMFAKNTTEAQMVMTFERDGKKISKIIMTSNGEWDKKGAMSRLQRLAFAGILPESRVVDRMMKDVCARAAKADRTVTYSLTWDGDNVSKFSGTMDGESMTVSFSYDDKNNPTQGFLFALVEGEYYGTECFSENNVTKIVYTYSDGSESESNEESFTYTYDGNWPLTRTSTYSYGSEAEGYRYEYKEITYYEYE